MATYHYKAKSSPGHVVEGFLDAESRWVALDKLSQKGYFPLRVEVCADPAQRTRWTFWDPVSKKDVSFLTRQLADLLESGVALPTALQLIQEQTENPYLTRRVQEILEKVRGGKHLSEALRDYPRVFSSLYVSLIYAGEVGGTLSATLSRLADFIEQSEDFRSRLKAALAYPLLIAFVGVGAVIFLMAFAVPRLAAMFVEMGQRMPWITRFLLSVSTGMVAWGPWMLAGIPLGGCLWMNRGWREKIHGG